VINNLKDALELMAEVYKRKLTIKIINGDSVPAQ